MKTAETKDSNLNRTSQHTQFNAIGRQTRRKSKQPIGGNLRGLFLAVAFILAFVASPTMSHAQFHGFNIFSLNTPSLAHMGDEIISIGHIINADGNNSVGDGIIVTKAYNVIYNFDNAIAGCPLRVTNFVDLAPFSSNNIVANACLGTNETFFGIRLPAQGSDLFLTNAWTVSCSAAGYGYTIPTLFVVEAVDTHDQDAAPCPLSWSASGADQIRVMVPCISGNISSTNGIGENGKLTYSGSVLNCGNSYLIHTFVESDMPTNHTPVAGPFVLAPGQSANFSGYFEPRFLTSGTFTVRASEAPMGQPVPRSLTNIVSCSTIEPYISVSLSNMPEPMIVLSFATMANKTYTVQFTDSFTPTNWQKFTNIIGDGRAVIICDGITNAQRFYRALVE